MVLKTGRPSFVSSPRLLVVLTAVVLVAFNATHAYAVSCSGLSAWSSSASYSAGASVTYNSHKWTICCATGASPYAPPDFNWWTDNGACDSGATPTNTATATATATNTPTPTTGATATRTNTSTATATATATATTSGGGTCSGVPAFATCTAYASGASVVFNNTKYHSLAPIPNTRDCPPSSVYDPSTDNWWQNDGACGGGPTPTATPTNSGATPTNTATPTATTSGGGNIGAIVSSSQFDAIWPPAQRATTYTYADFVTAANSYYPGLCGTGDTNTNKRECAAYFANKDQETGVGRYDRELYCNPPDGNGNGAGYNTTACGYNCTATDITNGWCGYCAPNNPCASDGNSVCATGQQYWGRHSIQLSWNTNYCMAGATIGLNLHGDPNSIFTNKVTGWRAANWYWMTQLGPAVSNGYGTWPMKSAHDAITATDASGNYGFAGTIRAINGGIECGSRVQQQINRVTYYNGSGTDEEDSSGGVLGVLGYTGGTFGRRFCAP